MYRQQRSVVYGWILSYLLLMVVMVLLTGVVYLIARTTIEVEINNSNLLLLESIRDTIDSSLKETNDFSMELFASPEIGEVSTLSIGDLAYDYKIYKAAQSLNNYKSFKDEFQNYYIYFGGIDKVIRPGIVNPSFFYYNNYIRRDDFSYEQWQETVGQVYYGEYTALPYRDPISKKNFSLAFIRSVAFPSPRYGVTNIIIMMNFDRILDHGGRGRGIAVLDGNGRMIVQSRPDMALEIADIQELPEEHGIFTSRSKGRKNIISYIASREYGWKYITVTPEDVFWEKSQFIRLIMWGEILLGIIGMGMLSFYFVRRNYNILYEITSFIRSKARSDTIYGGNEFNYIRQVLSQSIEEKEEAESQLDRHMAALRTNLLISIMEGNELSVPLDELLTSYNVSFPFPYYSVIAVYIDYVNFELWSDGEKNEYGMAKIAVMNLLEEIISRNNTAYSMEFRDHIICVVNTPLSWQEFRQRMDEDLKNARTVITQDLDIDVYAAVGGLYNSLEDIHRAYNEAKSSIDYVRIMESRKTVFFGDIGGHEGGIVIYPFKKERILLNHLQLSDFKAVREVLNDIFLTDLLNPSVSPDMAHFVVFAMTAQVLRNICADEEDMNRLLDINNRSIEQLHKSKTVIEMKEPVFHLLKCAMESEHHDPGRKSQPSAAVQDYILTHYANPLLCIGSIAEAIGKSPYYISKKFKMETGSGILEFIDKIRIEKAKALLQDAALTEVEIAERIGFTSVRTYQRVFKRVEGVTQSQFKQANPSWRR